MIFAFVWLLTFGGSQFSEPFTSLAACEEAREVAEVTKRSPTGREIERTYPCMGISR